MFWLLAFALSTTETALVEVRKPTVIWNSILRSNQVFVGTSDGVLHDIDLTSGDIMWSVDTGGAFFNSSVHNPENRVSLDGFIFMKSGNGLRKCPIPVRNLSETNGIVIKECSQVKSTVKSSSILVRPPTQIKRIDYEINITKSNEILHYSELSVITNTHDVINHVKIIAQKDSGLQIIVNDSIRQSVAVSGFPVSVMGPEGFFDFIAYVEGRQMSSSSVAIVRTETNSEVTVPAVSDANAIALPQRNRIGERVLSEEGAQPNLRIFDMLVPTVGQLEPVSEYDIPEQEQRDHRDNEYYVYAGLVTIGLLTALVLVGFEVSNAVMEQVQISDDKKQTLKNVVTTVVGKNINRVILRKDVIIVSKSKLLQRKESVFRQIQNLPVFDFLRSDESFEHFFNRVTEENALEIVEKHPLFWNSKDKERHIAEFFYNQHFSATDLIRENWTTIFENYDESHKSMIEKDILMRRIPRGDRDLLKYIRNKVTHANETKVHIESYKGHPIHHDTICTHIFDYMAEPFPGLFLAVFGDR